MNAKKFNLIAGIVAAVVVAAFLICCVSYVPNKHERMECSQNDECTSLMLGSLRDPTAYTMEKPSGIMVKNPFTFLLFECGWFGQIFTLFFIWYVLAFIFAEGSNDYKIATGEYPEWMGWLSRFIGGATKVAVVSIVVLGVSDKDKDKR